MEDYITLDKKMAIQTYTGRAFSVFSPDLEDINIEDIAHALSNLTRFTGHGKKFYSIAEHSVHVADLMPDVDMKLDALLHDAAEAYINDLATPLKHSGKLEAYREIERTLETAIRVKFDLWSHGDSKRIIKTYDRVMLKNEALELMSYPLIPEWQTLLDQIGPVPRVRISGWSPRKAKRKFLKAFEQYTR